MGGWTVNVLLRDAPVLHIGDAGGTARSTTLAGSEGFLSMPRVGSTGQASLSRSGCGSTSTCVDSMSAGSGRGIVSGKRENSHTAIFMLMMTLAAVAPFWLIVSPMRHFGELPWLIIVFIAATIPPAVTPCIFTTGHFPKTLWILWLPVQPHVSVPTIRKRGGRIRDWPSLPTTASEIFVAVMPRAISVSKNWLMNTVSTRSRSVPLSAERRGGMWSRKYR